jgi:UDP-2,3-diacylglucosamine pyrophosphatase LpxH
MKKEIIVIGDIEMGAGTRTDDFISDRALAKLILTLRRRKHSVDLVLNGDTFDFLKCPLIEKGKKTYPRHITEEISIKKLRLMHRAHERVFLAIRKFVELKRHKVVFIVGNHDQDLFYRGVQRKIREILHSRENVLFKMRYSRPGIHIEHGHQYDLINKMNMDKLFLSYKGQSILNISWVSLGIISDFLSLKEQHPLLERVKPWPILFSIYGVLFKRLSWRSIEFLVKSILYYPFRFYSDPTYTLPRTLLREIYYRMKNFDWEVEDVITSFKNSKQKIRKGKIYVFGHVHKKYLEDNGDWAIIQPDTWRDEYILDPKNKILRAKKKYYVKMMVVDGEVDWELKLWPIKRSSFLFNDVIRNETAHLKLAAQEEGYIPPDFTTEL